MLRNVTILRIGFWGNDLNYLATILLCFLSLEAMAFESLPDYLADPVVVDSQYPPAMWAGAIESDGEPLNTIMYMANGPGPHPTVVLLHGFPGNEKNLDLAQAMRRAGWNVVFFHYRGSWGSGGAYSIPNANADVSRIVSWLREPEVTRDLRVDPEKVALLGHSFGGFYALYGAVNNKDIACVAAIAASDIGAAAKRASSQGTELWPWLRGRQILKGFDRAEAIKDINANLDAYHLALFGNRLVDIPTLVVTPDGDGEWGVASQTAMAKAYQAAGVNLSFYLVKDADHSFNSKRIKLMEIVTGWLNQACLPGIAEPAENKE